MTDIQKDSDERLDALLEEDYGPDLARVVADTDSSAAKSTLLRGDMNLDVRGTHAQTGIFSLMCKLMKVDEFGNDPRPNQYFAAFQAQARRGEPVTLGQIVDTLCPTTDSYADAMTLLKQRYQIDAQPQAETAVPGVPAVRGKIAGVLNAETSA